MNDEAALLIGAFTTGAAVGFLSGFGFLESVMFGLIGIVLLMMIGVARK